jgi:RNA polymerase sigma-70 factor (ECF subfamily)
MIADPTELGPPSSDLRDRARRAFEAGRAAWPQIVLEFALFESQFARHSAPDSSPVDAHAADMYLACACANGVNAAMDALEQLLTGDVARAVASIHGSAAFVEDTLQDVRARLLVRAGGEPGKIVEYGGRASLRSWLRAVAVRQAISRRRRKAEQHRTSFSPEDDGRLASAGPEFEYIRGRYKQAFEEEVRLAIERLPSRERMLLRLNVVHGMSLDQLATTYGVARSTAARWLASARQCLLEEARAGLRAKLRLSASEFESLAEEVRSYLDVSIRKWLSRG